MKSPILPRIGAAFIAAWSLAACSTPAATATAVHWDSSVDMCHAWAQGHCDWLHACGAAVSVDACLADQLTEFAGAYDACARAYAPLFAERTLGRAVIDEAGIAACFQGASSACGLSMGPEACVNASGHVIVTPLTGHCLQDYDCGAGEYCDAGDVCRARAKLSEACGWLPKPQCGTELRCRSSACSSPLEHGDPCAFDEDGMSDPCGNGLFCDVTCKTGDELLATCQQARGLPCLFWVGWITCAASGGCALQMDAEAPVGHACDSTPTVAWSPKTSSAAAHSEHCMAGEACVTQPDGTRKCAAELPPNAACKSWDSCGTSVTCDTASHTCTAPADKGGDCDVSRGIYCAWPLLCNSQNKCESDLDVGPCKKDTDCISKHCGTDGKCVK